MNPNANTDAPCMVACCRRHARVGLAFVATGALLPGLLLGQVKNGPHDFTGGTYGEGINVCQYCHITHGDDQDTQVTPLWDHETTEAFFALYSSSTLDSQIDQPLGITLICLSCHDGTVAIDSVGGTAGEVYISGEYNLTTDLSDDHPVGFVYDSGLAQTDGGLYNPEARQSGLGGSVREDLLYEDSRFECGSCHNVHGKEPGLLRKSNANSELYLTCHIK